MYMTKLIKTLLSAVLGITLLAASPALAAGTLPLAMAQQIDINGQPLAGCQVTFFVAGTPATLQNAFADFGLTQALSNPIVCDQAGRVPMFWLADGLIHVRLTDAAGGPVIDTTMQVLGPSSGGGGGGGTVDPTALYQTGDLKGRYGTGPIAGFVRANGLTIGNGGSGATERANADTQNLFVYLYTTDPNLVVSGGRTGNALNDYNAGKTITTPDWAGRALAFVDDMGAGARGVLTSAYFGTSPTVLGAGGGAQSHLLSLLETPTGITSSGANSISVSGSNSFSASGANSMSGNNAISVTSITGNVTLSPGTTDNYTSVGGACCLTGQTRSAIVSTGPNNISVSGTVNVSGSVAISSSGSNSISVTSTNTGGQAHSIVPPERLATLYMKL